jgi:hypothetical protein
MNDQLFVIGIVFAVAGAFAVAWIRLYPESARREGRRVRNLTQRARHAGLRGRYRFETDRSKWGSTDAMGTYEPSDDGDRVLYAAVGSRIEGESAFWSSEMLWTDRRIAWLGIPALIIGVTICAISVFS